MNHARSRPLVSVGLVLVAAGWLVHCAASDETGAANSAEAGAQPTATTATSDAAVDAVAPPIVCPAAPASAASDRLVPSHHDGQTFVTWTDVAEGDAGAAIRYDVYRALVPITQANLAAAERVAAGVLDNSAKLFGTAFNEAARLDPSTGMTVTSEGGAPLPPWSGLFVHTAQTEACAYYAVIPVDETGMALGPVVPGENATTGPTTEHVAPRRPIQLYDSKSRGEYSRQTEISGTQNLPLMVTLHASNAQGGGAGDYGDYYLYYADTTMGYVDGMPGVYSVEETHSGPQNLMLRTRDTIVLPDGNGGETYWFGYRCTPEWAPGTPSLAYPFTEERLRWIVDQVVPRYGVDANRIGCSGGSMGAWGSTSFCFHHPETFSVVYPDRPRTRQTGLPTFGASTDDVALMSDGTTPYLARMDSVQFAADHHEDLPFYAFDIGRNDGFAPWQDQVDMVHALTESHHGFAFLWNDGDHSATIDIASRMQALYPLAAFSRGESYPAFSHSSIDDDLGTGDLATGAPSGGINLGFVWTAGTDEASRWQMAVSNTIAAARMTADLTPRRTVAFHPAAGDVLKWTTSTGGSGTVVADAWGLVTVPAVAIDPGQATTVTVTR